jgi:Cys-rich protein (TIGR01571 family)
MSYGQPYPAAPAGYSLHAQQGRPSYNTNYNVIPAFRRIMIDEFWHFYRDFPTCLAATFFPCIVSGVNQSNIEAHSCLCATICYSCCASPFRSSVQKTMGVPDSGCCTNWILHYCCPICSLTQESRAIRQWSFEGRPKPAPESVRM